MQNSFKFCWSYKLFHFVNNIHDKVINNYLLNNETIYNLFVFSNHEILYKRFDFLKYCLNSKLFQFKIKTLDLKL